MMRYGTQLTRSAGAVRRRQSRRPPARASARATCGAHGRGDPARQALDGPGAVSHARLRADRQ